MLKRTWISEPKHVELQQKTANEFHGLSAMIQAGWPETKQQVPHSIWEYWESRDELAVLDGVVYRGMKIVPLSMRPAMLKLIHGSHLGIMKCKQRAREVLHWSGMSAKIGNTSGIRRIEEKIVRIVIGIEFASETSNVIFFKSVHVLLFLMESLINKCQIVTYTCYYKNVSK